MACILWRNMKGWRPVGGLRNLLVHLLKLASQKCEFLIYVLEEPLKLSLLSTFYLLSHPSSLFHGNTIRIQCFPIVALFNFLQLVVHSVEYYCLGCLIKNRVKHLLLKAHGYSKSTQQDGKLLSDTTL